MQLRWEVHLSKDRFYHYYYTYMHDFYSLLSHIDEKLTSLNILALSKRRQAARNLCQLRIEAYDEGEFEKLTVIPGPHLVHDPLVHAFFRHDMAKQLVRESRETAKKLKRRQRPVFRQWHSVVADEVDIQYMSLKLLLHDNIS